MRSQNRWQSRLVLFVVVSCLLAGCSQISEEEKIERQWQVMSYRGRFLIRPFTSVHLHSFEPKLLGVFDYDLPRGHTSIPKTKWKGDTLIAHVDVVDNGCADFIGDIEFRGDSLFLFYQTKESCMSLEKFRLTYLILPSKKAKYRIGVRKKFLGGI